MLSVASSVEGFPFEHNYLTDDETHRNKEWPTSKLQSYETQSFCFSISECKSSYTLIQPTAPTSSPVTQSSFEVCKQTCQDNGKELASLASYTDYRCSQGSTEDQKRGVIVGAQEIISSSATHIVSRENGAMVKNFGVFLSREENGVFHEDGTSRSGNGNNGVNCIYLKYRSYYAVPCTLPYDHTAGLRCACKGESRCF